MGLDPRPLGDVRRVGSPSWLRPCGVVATANRYGSASGSTRNGELMGDIENIGFIICTKQPDSSWRPDWDGLIHPTIQEGIDALKDAHEALGSEFADIVEVFPVTRPVVMWSAVLECPHSGCDWNDRIDRTDKTGLRDTGEILLSAHHDMAHPDCDNHTYGVVDLGIVE